MYASEKFVYGLVVAKYELTSKQTTPFIIYNLFEVFVFEFCKLNPSLKSVGELE